MHHIDWFDREMPRVERLGTGGQETLRACIEYEGNFWRDLGHPDPAQEPEAIWIEHVSEGTLTSGPRSFAPALSSRRSRRAWRPSSSERAIRSS